MTLIEAPGHTPGTMALKVELADANVIFGHDAEQLWSLRRSPDGHYT